MTLKLQMLNITVLFVLPDTIMISDVTPLAISVSSLTYQRENIIVPVMMLKCVLGCSLGK